MQCHGCQHENQPGSNFCLVCGSRLGLQYARCGSAFPTFPGSSLNTAGISRTLAFFGHREESSYWGIPPAESQERLALLGTSMLHIQRSAYII
jgi:hypothetical protein